jgi:hypothetical protein
MIKSVVAALLLLILAAPALANAHKDTYPVSCSELWPAVKDTLHMSNYILIASDDTAMTASYTVGNSLRQRTNSVALSAQGTSCEMTVQSAYRGLAHDDAGDFKKRVDDSLAKLKAAKPAEPAKPPDPVK